MKLKIVVVDLQLSQNQRRFAAGALVAGCLGAATFARGAPPNTFSLGQTLKAADLNANFTNLDGRVGGLEAKATPDIADANGNVGIGTATPQGKLDVSGFGRLISSAYNYRSVAEFGGGSGSNNAILFNTGAPAGTTSIRGFGIASGTQDFSIARFDSAGAAVPTFDVTVLSNGNVGIGTSTPAYALDVNGIVRATNVSVFSDARLKTNVRTIDHALDDVGRLHGVRFDWKANGKPSVGVIAQEVEQVCPELVSTATDGLKSVDYMKLTAVLIESTKELRKENATLAARVEKLESRVTTATK
jgi:hypothetical protein